MSLFIPKQGYYLDNIQEVDIPAAKFRPYVYTEKEARKNFKKNVLPCFEINCNLLISLKNGWLKIKNNEYNIIDLLISDVIDLLEENGCDVYLFEGYTNLELLPAYFLKDFRNDYSVVSRVAKSPVSIWGDLGDLKESMTSIGVIATSLSRVSVYDLSSGEEIEKTFDEDESLVYFEPSSSTSISVQLLSTAFTVDVTFNSKLFTDTNIGNIIKNRVMDYENQELPPIS